MPNSIFDPAVQSIFDQARTGQLSLFPSPEDWRDAPIYFLMMDRFNNDQKPPKNLPYDAPFPSFQGGSFNGVAAQLQYIKNMGFGAIWLSPVFKNPKFDNGAYHGYGVQNFLAIEPRLASAPGNEEAELQNLVKTAHNLGLYIILDIVLHHAGDVFEYSLPSGEFDTLDWQNSPQNIRWKLANGSGNPVLNTPPPAPAIDDAVWPTELRQPNLFTRQGNALSPNGQVAGDFFSLKGIDFLDNAQAAISPQSILIRCYQYIVAKFDVDAFRIDTLKFIPPDFERTFANAVREFALSVGKKNFFTFGEVYDDQNTINQFIGRDTQTPDAPVGVDAALDYPLFFILPSMIKGQGPTPASVAQMFQQRKTSEEGILTSHGEAGQYFVTFLDNHDQPQRFTWTGPTQLIDQITLGIGCLFTLPGVPCVYYGTEQGLTGHKTPTQQDDSMVREALWGKTNPFDPTNPLYVAIQKILAQRATHAALRYGRYYFRPVSGNHTNFALSTFQTGVFAFSRILNDAEILIAANTDPNTTFTGDIIVDAILNTSNPQYKILYSNQPTPTTGTVTQRPNATVTQPDGSTAAGPATVLPMNLRPREFQILSA